MKNTISLIGLAAAAVLFCVSGAMNWSFGYSLGNNDFNGHIYGAASVAADVLKALSPFFIVWAFTSKKYFTMSAGILVISVCAFYSFTSSLGFSSSQRIASQPQEQITKILTTSNIETLKLNQRELKQVKAKLDTKLTRSERIRLRNRRKFLEGSIKQSQRDLGLSLIEIKKTTPAKTQQKFLSDLTSFHLDKIIVGLVLLLAILVEVGSGLGPIVALGHYRQALLDNGPSGGNKTKILQDENKINQENKNDNLVNLEEHKDKTVAFSMALKPGTYTLDQIKSHFKPVLEENNWRANNLANRLKGLGWKKSVNGQWVRPYQIAA